MYIKETWANKKNVQSQVQRMSVSNNVGIWLLTVLGVDVIDTPITCDLDIHCQVQSVC